MDYSDYADYIVRLPNGINALIVIPEDTNFGDAIRQLGIDCCKARHDPARARNGAPPMEAKEAALHPIRPLITGTGPVQVASTFTHVLDQMIHRGRERVIRDDETFADQVRGGKSNMPDIIISFSPAKDKRQPEVRRISRAIIDGTPVEMPPLCLSDIPTANEVDEQFSTLAHVASKFGIPIIGLSGIGDRTVDDSALAGALRKIGDLNPREIDARAILMKGRDAMPKGWNPKNATFNPPDGAMRGF